MFKQTYNNYEYFNPDTEEKKPFVTGRSPFSKEYAKFISEYPGRGTLKVQLSIADEAFPIKDVIVDVALIYKGVRYTIYNDVSDSSGIVSNMVLPTRHIDSTLTPEFANTGEAQYLVSVYHPGFDAINDCVVTIHDRIETILPLSLTPIARKAGSNG